MEWKKHLRDLEKQKSWDQAIAFMENIVEKHPDNADAYIDIIFLLMNILVEEQFDTSKHDYYAFLLEKYFDASHQKFSDNAAYLFCVGMTASMAEWYVGLEVEDYQRMLRKALELDPDDLMYQSNYYLHLDRSIPENKAAAIKYAQLIHNNDPSLLHDFISKGACGEYWLGCMQGWSKAVLKLPPYENEPD
jgi:tetratricopeptide (TPR) repeat protein